MGIERIAVLASGRGTNLQAIIEAVRRGDIEAEIALVISDRRDALALKRARDAGIEALYIDPENEKPVLKGRAEERYIEELKKRGVSLICLAGFMRIVKKRFISSFSDHEYPSRILNIHPSLLPAFKGLHAQRRAFEYGVKYAGCSVHFVTEDVDGGPIILQAVVPVYDDDTPEILEQRILKEEHRIYPLAIDLVLKRKVFLKGRRVLLRK